MVHLYFLPPPLTAAPVSYMYPHLHADAYRVVFPLGSQHSVYPQCAMWSVDPVTEMVEYMTREVRCLWISTHPVVVGRASDVIR